MEKEPYTIFMTGSNGFIGPALCKSLLEFDYKIHGLLLNEEEEVKVDGVIPHYADLRDYEKIDEILKEVNPDIIIHLAARTEVEKSFYEQMEFSEINYCGTINLIEKARTLKNLKLFLFSSTMETYGAVYSKEQVLEMPETLNPFNESTQQFPNAPYSVAKIGCEKYLEYVGRCFNFPYCILRQTNTYGRPDNDFFVVEQIITQMLQNKDEINLGYPEPYRNFLYIDDLIHMYVAILRHVDDVKYAVFCTGPNNALSIENLAKLIAKKLSWDGKINWNTKRERPGEIYYLNSTNFEAEVILGWTPLYKLSEGLDKTIEMLKKKLNIE